jgi:hypothetical protein
MLKIYFIHKAAGKKSIFSYEVKTGPIYGMETNIKSGNG